jgi:quercetin dioxygenase-like cupin family protein
MIDRAGAQGKISLSEIVAELTPPLSRRDVVRVNEGIVRVAGLEGDLPFHHHDEDEFFLCWEGTLRIELADGDPVELGPGDVFVVPRGAEHRPVAEGWAVVLLIERPETQQLGS